MFIFILVPFQSMLSIAIKDMNLDVENWVALILVLGFLIKQSFYPNSVHGMEKNTINTKIEVPKFIAF